MLFACAYMCEADGEAVSTARVCTQDDITHNSHSSTAKPSAADDTSVHVSSLSESDTCGVIAFFTEGIASEVRPSGVVRGLGDLGDRRLSEM